MNTFDQKDWKIVLLDDFDDVFFFITEHQDLSEVSNHLDYCRICGVSVFLLFFKDVNFYRKTRRDEIGDQNISDTLTFMMQ